LHTFKDESWSCEFLIALVNTDCRKYRAKSRWAFFYSF